MIQNEVSLGRSPTIKVTLIIATDETKFDIIALIVEA